MLHSQKKSSLSNRLAPIAESGRLMANGDFGGLMWIYFHPINPFMPGGTKSPIIPINPHDRFIGWK